MARSSAIVAADGKVTPLYTKLPVVTVYGAVNISGANATVVPLQVIPLSDAPSQTVGVQLNNQPCRLFVYTKSIFAPIAPPGMIESDPTPVYENKNPVFLDLYLNDVLVVGGVLCRDRTLILRDSYLGFSGDLAFVDIQGTESPYGVPLRLPPLHLRNWWQLSIPRGLTADGKAPASAGPGTCPGLGTRFLLTYWPPPAVPTA